MTAKYTKPMAFLLASVMLFALMLMGTTVRADDGEPTQVGDVYQLSSVEDMEWFAAQVNAGNTAINGILLNDIDLSVVTWTPIGKNTSGYRYTGTFDGDGHTVTLDHTSTANYQGLFGYAAAGSVIKNVTVTGSVSGGDYTGGIVGYSAGTVEDCVNKGAVSGTYRVGGVAGYVAATGIVSRCGNTGSVTATDSTTLTNYGVGGVVGSLLTGGVTQCFNTGDITGDGMNVGGVVGAMAGKAALLTHCYNIGAVESTSTSAAACVGGVAGRTNQDGTTIQSCYNAGDVTGADAAVNGSNYIGGVAGCVEGVTNVTDNYYLDGTATMGFGYATATEENVKAVSAEQLRDLAGDLGSVYKNYQDGVSFPILDWQAATATFTVTPSTASVVVKNSEENTITANTDGSYTLLKGETYNYTISADGYETETGSITAQEDESIAATLTEIYSVTVTTYPKRADVTVKDSDGTVIAANEDGTYDLADGTYTYTATMPGYKDATGSFSVENGELKGLETITLTADVNLSVFKDVNTSLWYKNAVEYSVANNLFTGTSATTWEPDTALSRAMFVTVLGKYEGVSNSDYATCEFNDVADGLWYTGFVQWAYNEGLVAGTGGGNFSPNDSITRQEMAVIFYKYAASKGCDMTASASAFSGFPDKDEADSWAVTALTWATDRGIINGSGGKLMPKDTATRAQAAQIFMRIIEDIL